MGRKGWVTKMKEGLVKKHEQAFANHHPNPDQKLFDPNSPTILKLQCIVSGILSGQVTNSQVTDQHIEVLISFESYYSKKGTLTSKQLEWCKSLLYKYRDIILQLMRTGIKPVVITTEKEIQPTEDHRKYERIVEFDEPKKPHRRGRLIKEDE